MESNQNELDLERKSEKWSVSTFVNQSKNSKFQNS